VGAKDLGTGKEQSIKITASGGLSEEEIKRMQREAEEHKAEDEKRKELVNARNTLDGLIYSIEKTLKEHADKVDATEKTKVEAALVEAKKHLESQDLETLKKATEELTAASNKMAEQMYKQAGAAGSAGPGAQASGGSHADEKSDGKPDGKPDAKKDDVIDADFKEV
jgi:molecular chaperone DnaK